MKVIHLPLLFCVLSFNTNAQLGGLINKAKNKIEQKSEEKKKEEQKSPQNNSSGSNNQQSPQYSSPAQPSASSDEAKYDPLESFTKENLPDEGMTSEVHKSNINKIIFSKSHIVEGKENAAEFTTTFSGNDLIYARCYLPQSLYNIPCFKKDENGYGNIVNDNPVRNFSAQFRAQLFIDGKPVNEISGIKGTDYDQGYGRSFFIELKTNDARQETDKTTCSLPANNTENTRQERIRKTTFEIYINSAREEKDKNIGTDWPLIANALSPGEHFVKLIIWPYDEWQTLAKEPCVSEFKYIKKAGDYVPYGRNFALLNKKSYMKDAALETKLKKVVESLGDEPTEKVKVVKLGIDQDRWTVNKNYLGVPEFKAISIWFVVKDSFGYCQMGYMDIRAYYNGKGGYDEPLAHDADPDSCPVGGRDFVDCSTVK